MEDSLQELSWTDVRELFRTWREDNDRQSSKIVEYWERMLQDKAHKLADERFLILEQVCIAAADTNRLDILDQCLQELSIEFPDSLRVKRLHALRLEVMGRYDEALDLLTQIIKIDETNAAPRKRRIAIWKSKGNNTEAIKELTEYLKKFMSDQEAWQELSDLYLSEQEYSKAAFCLEECILNSPHNHLYHQRYAEIKYTQGGYDNLEVAKAHYCLAVKLSPNNMRALYGLLLCATNISVNQKTPSQKKKEATKLAKWASQQICDRYKEATPASEDGTAIEGLLSNLQITSS